jgi:hypothetical protein
MINDYLSTNFNNLIGHKNNITMLGIFYCKYKNNLNLLFIILLLTFIVITFALIKKCKFKHV